MDPSSGEALVGRDPELSALHESLSCLMRGRGGILWVEGEPGIGKTALVDTLLRQAAGRGAATLRGAGDELMQEFPLRLMAACLGVSQRSAEGARREIAGLLRGEPGATHAGDPILAAAERMLELVDRLCAEGPLVLVAEDLQWADEPSLRVWNRLAHAVDQIPLLLVGVARPSPYRLVVERLRESVRERSGTVLELGPLAPRHVADLAARIAGGVPGPRLRAELVRAGGNSLYVRELLGALIGERMIAVGDGVAEFGGTGGATPGSLATAIGRRLSFLSEQARKTLRLAALHGHEFDAGQVAVVAGLPVAALADVVSEAVNAGVLNAAGERLSFRHELIQQVLVEQIPAAMRRTLHSHIARSLADAGGGVDAVARHLLAMPDALDEWALDWLAQVAPSSLDAVPHVSAELLLRALRLAREVDPRREALATRLAQALFWLGRDEEVVEVASDVARRTTDSVLAARMWILVVRSAGRAGRTAHALDVAGRAKQTDGLPLSWRSRLEAWSAVVLTSSGQGEAGRAAAADALAHALRSGDALTIAYAHHATSYSAETAAAVAHVEQALAILGPDAESMDLRTLLTYNRLIWLAQLGRTEEYGAALREALILAERVGTVRAAGLLGAAAEVGFLRGDWDEATVYLEGVDPAYSGTSDQVYLHGLAAVIALHRGERDRAAKHLAVIDAVVPEGAQHTGTRCAHLAAARALRAEADGDPARALALTATWLTAAPGPRRNERDDEAPYLVRLALEAGDQQTAAAAADAIAAEARAEPLPRRLAAARCCRAQLDDDVDGLLAVAEDYRRYGWPLQLGFALEEAAVRLAAAGQRARARSVLTDAVGAYAALGASWDIRRADARLRAHGIRRGPRSAHRRETAGWAALTASEVKIARLVGDGWSNPDIAAELYLSRRTVQTHVSNILAKLQLRSRVEVVRAVVEHDVPHAAVRG